MSSIRESNGLYPKGASLSAGKADHHHPQEGFLPVLSLRDDAIAHEACTLEQEAGMSLLQDIGNVKLRLIFTDLLSAAYQA